MKLIDLERSWTFRLVGGGIAVALLAWASVTFFRSAWHVLRTGQYRDPAGRMYFGREARGIAWFHILMGTMAALAASAATAGVLLFRSR